MKKLIELYLKEKIKEWEERKPRLREIINRKLTSIDDVQRLIEPLYILNLPSFDKEFPPVVRKYLLNWLWSGLPPIYVDKEILENGKEIFVFYVPGENKTIYQVVLVLDDIPKFYCPCRRNEGALSWLITTGWCQHKIKTFYWITGRYKEIFNSFTIERKERIINKWEQQLKKYRSISFEVKLINTNALAVGRLLSLISKNTLRKIIKFVDKIWLKYSIFKDKLEDEY